MAAGIHFEDVFFNDLGADVAPQRSDFRVRCQNVNFCNGARGLEEGSGVLGNSEPDSVEEVGFEGGCFFFGTEDLGFVVFEFSGDVALGVGGGLFADVVGGDFGDVLFGDFDVIAEDGVEPDFESVDSGLFSLTSFQAGDEVFAISAQFAEFVEFVVVVGANDAPVPDGVGWLGDDGFVQK